MAFGAAAVSELMLEGKLPHAGYVRQEEIDFEDFAAAHFLIGDAIEVRDQLQRYAEATGSDHFLMRIHWPGLEQAEALANIERIGKLI